MNICKTHLKLRQSLTDVTEGILNTECTLQHLTKNLRIKNLDGFERNEADA